VEDATDDDSRARRRAARGRVKPRSESVGGGTVTALHRVTPSSTARRSPVSPIFVRMRPPLAIALSHGLAILLMSSGLPLRGDGDAVLTEAGRLTADESLRPMRRRQEMET
jgi:hypothetical protein